MNCQRIFTLLFLFSIFAIPAKGKINKPNPEPANRLNSDSNSVCSIDKAISFANEIFKGEIVKIEKKFKKDIPVWKIDMQSDSGAMLEIEISYFTGELINLTGNAGPFNYEIVPGKDFTSFQSSKKTAENHAGIRILKWKFLKNKDKWEYNFWLFTKGGKAQVRIDGKNGELRIKN